jgi:hypothetical protein
MRVTAFVKICLRTTALSMELACLAACGRTAGAPPAAPGPSTSAPEPGTSVGADAASSLAKSVAPPGTSSARGEDYDVVKGRAPVNLKPLFERGASPQFPLASTLEQDCWRTLGVSGNARQDYEAITTRCGTPTGALRYVRPAIGHLHHKYQRRDTFVLPLQGGLCYRFFGVGDSTINDLDILIEQRGALVGEDRTTGPVAIIDSDKAWCIDRDGVYSFLVQTHGEGHGQYVFGVWARKDTK